ncbi:hypothetical protein C8R47DRAFT_669559 [Mycena vitilis]|nr:hypothetical protein C8R47DRAFT_669559 [Mycena vitilis]
MLKMLSCDARWMRGSLVENDASRWKDKEGLFGSEADIPQSQTTALPLSDLSSGLFNISLRFCPRATHSPGVALLSSARLSCFHYSSLCISFRVEIRRWITSLLQFCGGESKIANPLAEFNVWFPFSFVGIITANACAFGCPSRSSDFTLRGSKWNLEGRGPERLGDPLLGTSSKCARSPTSEVPLVRSQKDTALRRRGEREASTGAASCATAPARRVSSMLHFLYIILTLFFRARSTSLLRASAPSLSSASPEPRLPAGPSFHPCTSCTLQPGPRPSLFPFHAVLACRTI